MRRPQTNKHLRSKQARESQLGRDCFIGDMSDFMT